MCVGGIYSIIYGGQEKLKGGRKINRFDILEIQVSEQAIVGGSSDIPF